MWLKQIERGSVVNALGYGLEVVSLNASIATCHFWALEQGPKPINCSLVSCLNCKSLWMKALAKCVKFICIKNLAWCLLFQLNLKYLFHITAHTHTHTTCRDALIMEACHVIEPLALHLLWAGTQDIWHWSVGALQPHHQPFSTAVTLERIAPQVSVEEDS